MTPSHRLKLDRALELFRQLRVEIEAYLQSRPFTLDHTTRPATEAEVNTFAALPKQLPGRLRITRGRTGLIAHEARLVLREEPKLEKWSLQVSEVVQHLRSSLDNLVYSLATSASSCLIEKQARQLCFPICDDAKDWKDAEKKLRLLTRTVTTRIESYQPYLKQDGPNWSLRVLQYFNNLDKHRSLFMVGARPTSITIEGVQTLEDGYTPMTQTAIGAIGHGTVVALCLSPVQFPSFRVADSYTLEIALPNVPLPNRTEHMSVLTTLGIVGRDITAISEEVEKS